MDRDLWVVLGVGIVGIILIIFFLVWEASL
jgi:hypothetical protein